MRLFLAATEELATSRDMVLRVVEEINRDQAPAGRFELIDWSPYVAEEMGAERVPLLRLRPGDIFLGLAWLRFGVPTAEEPDADVEGAFTTGTEEDFELAYRSWASAPRTACLFYRCKKLPAQLSDINGEQLTRVERFFGRFGEPNSPGSYFEFQEPDDLGERLRQNLVQVRQSLQAAAPQASVAVPSSVRDVRGTESLPAYAKKMQAGKAYEVSFLAVDMVGFAQLAEEYPDQLDAVETLHRSFKQLLLDTAATYGGEVFAWDADKGTGILMFWSKRGYDHAMITGLKVIHGLPVFNLDPIQNPLGWNLEIRTAAHDAVIVFHIPVEEITAPDLDFLLELRESYTAPGELCVTKRLLDRADPRLKARFKGKGRFEREPVYSCRLPSTAQHALRANLDEVIKKVKVQASLIKSQISQPSAALEATVIEAISAGVDEAYELLDRACKLVGAIDASWSKKFLAELAGMAHVLVREEEELWMVLRRGHVQHRDAAGVSARLEAIVRTASSQRSRPAVTLKQAVERLRAHASEDGAKPAGAPAAAVDEDLNKKIQALLRADPLDYETALTDLLLSKKAGLIQFLTAHKGSENYETFCNRLWEAADLLLIDDLYSIRGHQRAGDTKIFDVLVHEPVADGRFQVVRQLLREEFRPSEDLVRQRFQQIGLPIENRDLQVVWRSIVIGHPTIKTRTLAAFKMSQFAMWQTIAHPSVPIPTIHAIGERISKAEGEDPKKIFFDCIRSRVVTAVESFQGRDELSAITKLILLLLDFPFLVETGYFERFDDVLEKFLYRAHQLNTEVEYFENLRQRLESAKRDPDASKANKPPKGITKLPLTIQRRLASEKHYLHWFVTHPDPRVATETVRHIQLANVERILRSPEINGSVMQQLLKKPELYTRSGPLLTALNNPKCDLTFANRYLSGLTRSRGGLQALEKLSRNPSANPAVRSAAQRLAQQKKQRGGAAGRRI